MNIRKFMCLLLIIFSSASYAKFSIKELVFGDKGPYFAGIMVEDFNAVKQGVYNMGQDVTGGIKNVWGWSVGLKDWFKNNIKKNLRIYYQLTKVAAGAGITTYAPWVCPPSSRNYDRLGNKIEPSKFPSFKNVFLPVGGALMIHGVRGLVRECGFDGFKHLFNYCEGN